MTSMTLEQPIGARSMSNADRKVILAACAGTVFEWYDFFLYGAMAAIIGAKFFGQFDEGTRNIFALLTFGLGFVVRPLGALVFGRLGDLIGRKSIFLATMIVMGIATVAVGILPTSDEIGIAAPVGLLFLRVLQGLAVSGEFGGAVIYVAEHAPPGRRGFYTGWIPASVVLSLLLALLVITATQTLLSAASVDAWGWRLPFLLSALLLALSVWIRLRLEESPTFLKMRAEGRRSSTPVAEAFGTWANLKVALIALFGVCTGIAATGYTGTFYALVFLTAALRVDGFTANLVFAIAMLAGTMSAIGIAWLSDRIGRKPILLAGCLLAALGYGTIFRAMAEIANPPLIAAQRAISVTIDADPATCSFQFNPAQTAAHLSACDIAVATLARAGVSYRHEALPAGSPASVTVGQRSIAAGPDFAAALNRAVVAAGYPSTVNEGIIRLHTPADIVQARPLSLIGLVILLVLLAQMTQVPAAAALVELFPTAIRYTSMSLPYQIGTGWIGGLLPATMIAINAATGSLFAGLWYPIIVAGVTFVVGLLFLPETKDRDIAA
jgi:MFS family permease